MSTHRHDRRRADIDACSRLADHDEATKPASSGHFLGIISAKFPYHGRHQAHELALLSSQPQQVTFLLDETTVL